VVEDQVVKIAIAVVEMLCMNGMEESSFSLWKVKSIADDVRRVQCVVSEESEVVLWLWCWC